MPTRPSGIGPTTRSSSFERSLCAEGTILVKFWLHISDDEQLARFNARADDPLKAWKLTDDDWRNREKRGAYEEAIKDMLQHTDHKAAPWTLVAAESKAYARVAVVETVIDALEQRHAGGRAGAAGAVEAAL